MLDNGQTLPWKLKNLRFFSSYEIDMSIVKYKLITVSFHFENYSYSP